MIQTTKMSVQEIFHFLLGSLELWPCWASDLAVDQTLKIDV